MVIHDFVLFSLKEYRRSGWKGLLKRIQWILFQDERVFPVPYSKYEWERMKRKLASKERERREIRKSFEEWFEKSELKQKKTVIYVIPGTAISGGIAIVLNHANRLQQRGYDVLLVSLNMPKTMAWFQNTVPIISVHQLEWKHIVGAEVVIATHWSTAFFVDLLPVRRKAYFVQSDERRFNPDKPEEQATIEATYRLPLEYLTEARWIQRWLKREFGHDVAYVPNGLNESFLSSAHSEIPRSSKQIRVLLEGPIDSWFKGMKEAYEAVKGLDVELFIVSSSGKPPAHWKYDQFFSNVPIDEMGNIYASCDIFVKLSQIEGFFGPPLEAMACGCSVVAGRVTGYDEYIVNEENALVVDPGDVAGARAAIVRLMTDTALRERLTAAGRKTAEAWQWGHSIDRLEKFVRGEWWEESIPEDREGQEYDYPTEMARLREVWRARANR